MVRRRLYHTLEEKIAANRAKSKRFYDKEKDIINKNRRKKYAKAHKKSASAQNDALKERQSNYEDMHSATPRRPVTVWLERANCIAARLQKFTGDDARCYLRRIVEGFLSNQDKDAVYEQIVGVSKLQRSVYRYEDEVLTLAGLGEDYEQVREVTRAVCDVVSWLEEVLCSAMVDAAEVEIKYKGCQFSFQ